MPPTGQTIDAPLSDVGLQQAEAAGHYLKDVAFTNVFVSDMLRAKQVQDTSLTSTWSLFIYLFIYRSLLCCLSFFFSLSQTAETIMKHNSSCCGLQMVCDPLLKEIVSGHVSFEHNLLNIISQEKTTEMLFFRFPELWNSRGRTNAGR